MAVYKVIQDIEAEDKLVGPLTLKGFVYAGITALLGVINYKLLIASVPIAFKLPVICVLVMPMTLFAVLASPLGREQPTEVWLLARVRFFLKPKQRIWNQMGISQLVTITVPKKLERQLTKGFSQIEVESRLKALANTLDSRGWAVKNINVNLNSHPDYLMSTDGSSDRLVSTPDVPQEAQVLDVHADDDILDEKNNPTAQNFETLIEKAQQERRNQMTARLETARAQAAATPIPAPVPPTEAAGQKAEPPIPVSVALTPVVPQNAIFTDATVIKPGVNAISIPHPDASQSTTSDEQQLLDKLHQREELFKTIEVAPPSIVKLRREKIFQPTDTMTSRSQAVKLELAQSGNDLSVASIAKLANHPENA
jgi:hypothetical protein